MATFAEQGSNTQNYFQSGSDSLAYTEGPIAKSIEQHTAKLPSDLFLWAAMGSIGISLALELSGNSEKAHFVGQWVAPFLLLGVYNKLVKLNGSERVQQ
jgi:hypothetical protein